MAAPASASTFTPAPPPPTSAAHMQAFDQLSDLEKDVDYAWQYHGYPALSKWMASANDFFILRRFSPLQARCLLYLQNEIAAIHRGLDDWDQYAQKRPKGTGQSGSFSNDPFTKRTTLLKQAIPLLQQYNDLVNSFSQLKAKQTADDRQCQNIENWFETYPNAIDPDEQHFRDQQGDLFPLLATPKSPLITLLQRLRLLRFRFTLSKRPDRIDSPYTRYTSEHGMETAISIITLVVGLGMLFASVWWLNFVEENKHRLGIITGSVSLFTVWSWLAAGNKPFEILAAVAGYTAVLMIYRQLS
ncbi:hypothetical protein B0A55_06891 [Friedmanniomyces simplex]|uniref:DUF6594 domain-containing protein n=1 Tax=Friedmanniomyces simplex TaxID=329884 RepID=A0A4U0XAL1_9PEZI|nr:hypothetical protein B0A55_06891 [Friedmanniomyces simplex]